MEIYFNGAGETCVTITNSDGVSWSGLKSAYDLQRPTPTQGEIDAEATAIATAKTLVQAQADSEAKAKVAFDTQLAATNAKLMTMGFTANDLKIIFNN